MDPGPCILLVLLLLLPWELSAIMSAVGLKKPIMLRRDDLRLTLNTLLLLLTLLTLDDTTSSLVRNE
jgi:hypothetical protein